MDDLVIMDGEMAEYEITPPPDRADEHAGYITIRVQHANDEDREYYGAESPITFWKPSSRKAIDMYRRESKKVNPDLKKNSKKRLTASSTKKDDYC